MALARVAGLAGLALLMSLIVWPPAARLVVAVGSATATAGKADGVTTIAAVFSNPTANAEPVVAGWRDTAKRQVTNSAACIAMPTFSPAGGAAPAPLATA